MFTVQQVVLIDNDMDGNARKLQVITNDSFSKCVKVSVNSGIALLYLQQQNEVLKNLPRLIILNVDTPIMNGFEFLSELKNSKTICTNNLTIAVLKDNLTVDQMEKLRIMGVTNFIAEDFRAEELSKIVKKQFIKSFNHQQVGTPSRLDDLRGLQGYAA